VERANSEKGDWRSERWAHYVSGGGEAVKRFASVVVALVGVALLASCGFNPLSWLPRDHSQLSANRMAEIVEAVNSQDAAVLRNMFTEYALAEYSDEIDDGLAYLLSLFPDGDLVWEDPEYRPSYAQSYDERKVTVMVGGLYDVSSGGKDYWLYFSYFTVNDQDPQNVGIYGIGVAPRTETKSSGPEEVFFSWAGSVSGLHENDAPGVYIPSYDNIDLSDRMMEKVVEDLTAQDVSGLRVEVFSEYAQTEHAAALDDEIDALYAFVPSGDLTWRLSDEPLVVREKVEDDDEAILLLPVYEVSSGGKDYWLFFADFTVNTIDPDNLGLYAVGVAPRTESGDSPQEQALFAWAETFDVDATTPPGILISQ
jgi:hypothetical protein